MTDHLALNPGKSLPAEIKRLTFDLIGHARQHIQTFEDSPDVAVHEIRKRMKEMRAVLRLIRDSIGKRGYRIENLRLRDGGRLLSSARDCQVLMATLLSLSDDYPEAFAESGGLDRLQSMLSERHCVEMERTALRLTLEKIESNLIALQRHVEMWSFHRADFQSIAGGLGRVYERGREALFDARQHPTDRNLHEWRKQVKYLWYHIRMLAPSWPTVLEGLAESLHDLSDTLGTDHDLAIFAGTYQRFLIAESIKGEGALAAIIEEKRRKLLRQAWSSGVLIYVEEPKAFVIRMEAYWRTAARML